MRLTKMLAFVAAVYAVPTWVVAQDPGAASSRTTVSGMVLYRDGAPAPGVKVSVIATESGGTGFWDEVVASGADGAYEAVHALPVASGAALVVAVSAIDEQGQAIADATPRTVAAGASVAGVDLVLDREFRISNFRAGYVCDRDDGTRELCRESAVIDVKGESVCGWDGEDRRCTWFGYSFDYENADPAVPLECTYARSNPSDEGDRTGIRQRRATSGEFELKLDGASGHSFNPGFELYSVPQRGAMFVVTTDIECSYRGEQVFTQTFHARYSSRW